MVTPRKISCHICTHPLYFVFRDSSKSRVQCKLFSAGQFVNKSIKLRTVAHAFMNFLHLGYNTAIKI